MLQAEVQRGVSPKRGYIMEVHSKCSVPKALNLPLKLKIYDSDHYLSVTFV